MEKIKDLLYARKQELLRIKTEMECKLENAPEGALRISGHGEQVQYYHRKNSKDVTGNYIKEKDFFLAKALAQKDYNTKILYSVNQELNAIDKCLSMYPDVDVKQVYHKLHWKRQKLVEPIWLSDDEYVTQWENFPYQGNGFDDDVPEFYTAKGERVRSKSEVIIADLLNKEGIPYRYECPIYLKGIGLKYPDFTVLNVRKRKEIFWEHLGMMDEPSYAERAVRKIRDFERNGIFPGENLILTYETRRNPINQRLLKTMIERYLK